MKNLIKGFIFLMISIILIQCKQKPVERVKRIKIEEKKSNKIICYSKKDTLKIKDIFNKIISSKKSWNESLYSSKIIDTELVNSVLNGNSKIKNIKFTGNKAKFECPKIKIEVYTFDLFKDDEEEHLIEKTIQIELIQKNKNLKVFNVYLLAG